jgi:hypothetical protein
MIESKRAGDPLLPESILFRNKGTIGLTTDCTRAFLETAYGHPSTPVIVHSFQNKLHSESRPEYTPGLCSGQEKGCNAPGSVPRSIRDPINRACFVILFQRLLKPGLWKTPV